MSDIKILTLDKIGKGLGIDPNGGKLNLLISDDPNNMITVDPSNKITVNGVFVENIPNTTSIAWTGVTISDVNIHSGLSDLSNPLQVGKDLAGNIWVRGSLTNTGSSLAANSIVGVIPVDWQIKDYAEDLSFYQLANVQSSLAGNTAALFLRMQNYNYVQSLAFSGTWATNVSFTIPPTIIGKAKYGFAGGAIIETAPMLANVTWVNVNITNANINTGRPPTGENPLQVGKDTLGNLWMRGAVTDIATAVAANGIIGTIPVAYQLKGYANANSFCQLVPVQSSLAGNTTALFLRLKNYTNVQSIAFSGSIATNVSFMLQPTIIGRALTP